MQDATDIIFDILRIILMYYYYDTHSGKFGLYLKQILSLFGENATPPKHEINEWVNIISNYGIMINYQNQTIFQQYPTIINEYDEISTFFHPIHEIFNLPHVINLSHSTEENSDHYSPFIYNESHCLTYTYEYYRLCSILLECLWITVWGI